MARSNIVLSGFMASGKSTVGRILSDETGMRLIETDGMVEKEAGATVEEIFRDRGEGWFRELERAAVRRAAAEDNVIIAVGGGAVVDLRNVIDLRRSGVIYLLEVVPGDALQRAGEGSDRPLLGGEERQVEELMRTRERAYAEAADVVVKTTGRPPAEIAGEIAVEFSSRSGGKK